MTLDDLELLYVQICGEFRRIRRFGRQQKIAKQMTTRIVSDSVVTH